MWVVYRLLKVHYITTCNIVVADVKTAITIEGYCNDNRATKLTIVLYQRLVLRVEGVET